MTLVECCSFVLWVPKSQIKLLSSFVVLYVREKGPVVNRESTICMCNDLSRSLLSYGLEGVSWEIVLVKLSISRECNSWSFSVVSVDFRDVRCNNFLWRGHLSSTQLS